MLPGPGEVTLRMLEARERVQDAATFCSRPSRRAIIRLLLEIHTRGRKTFATELPVSQQPVCPSDETRVVDLLAISIN